ncbi:hypothetical protein BB561_004146 [Smittium simulii]|uniref:Succinylglutamate desuccinylase/Aspartoacylase catalytic domain-containing protein n=1 Tax=Smittium simulii TaxID=133385 RepID=A0A2T9YHS6_9FUNG|nr:hypothetical protein BB561_004146 [Smittium simulii]
MVKVTILFSSVLGLLCSLNVSAKTEYTGDIINGHKVISKLDVSDFPLNTLTKLWLQMPRQVNGQAYQVPVIVAKGKQDGNRFLMNSGIHGDELNGIRVVQRVLHDIDLSKLNGVVVGVPGANVNGMYESTRWISNKENSGSYVNLNREMPGEPNKGSFGQRYAAHLWSNMYGINNFTVVCDFHTTSTSGTYPNFVYANLSTPYGYRISELTGADVVKIDLGVTAPGSVQSAFGKKGIPSITYEIGNGKFWQKDQIQRGYDYSFRQIADLDMYPATTDLAKIETYEKQRKNIYYGNELLDTKVKTGGFVELYANPMDIVKKDQIIGTMFDVFGSKVEDFYPKADGLILSTNVNPLITAGNFIVTLIRNSTDPACINGC